VDWIRLAIIALSPVNMDLLVEKPPASPICIKIKNCRYQKPDTMVTKTGYRWKTMNTLNPQFARDCCTDTEILPLLYVFHMNNINTKI
jgi:hypothetical protein